MKLTPGGAMSTWVSERARPGDQVTFTGPHGSFFLRETDRPVMMLVGGTGLAPILSMLRKLRADGSPRPVRLLYGVSTDADVVKLDELRELDAALPAFSWDYVVSDPASQAPRTGYVMSLIRPEHLYQGDVAIYLCGPPPMVESVRQHLAAEHIEPTGFYYEKFALAVPGAAEVPEESAADGTPAPEDDAGTAGPLLMPSGIADDEPDLIIAGEGRALAGQDIFAVPRTPAAPVAEVADDGYQIGEEHPDIRASDAVFEAREALELGALELTIGRMSSQQLTGYRLLAEATVPYVDVPSERFTNAEDYTEANAAFHDYLFTQTGNAHLLQAYTALGVKNRMADALHGATWCHPLIAQDHLDIVTAFDAGDRDRARTLIAAHAERSKQTMRRAMTARRPGTRPRFITPGRFTGQVVVITGAAQGIGAAVARRISAEGGQVVLADRSDLVTELAGELTADGGDATAVTADLEQWTGAQTVITQAAARYGRIDVLVNNVGGAINFKPFTEFTDTEITAEIDRSLMTTLFACRAALPPMTAAGRGVIVNVSSAATRGIHRIPYSAAKGGVNALTASLAMEYAGAGIRVVATAPGGTDAPPRRISRGTPEPANDTERAWFAAHIDQTLDSALLHRYGTLEEQSAAICFLASPEASYITGTVLPVAGGDLG